MLLVGVNIFGVVIHMFLFFWFFGKIKFKTIPDFMSVLCFYLSFLEFMWLLDKNSIFFVLKSY